MSASASLFGFSKYLIFLCANFASGGTCGDAHVILIDGAVAKVEAACQMIKDEDEQVKVSSAGVVSYAFMVRANNERNTREKGRYSCPSDKRADDKISFYAKSYSKYSGFANFDIFALPIFADRSAPFKETLSDIKKIFDLFVNEAAINDTINDRADASVVQADFDQEVKFAFLQKYIVDYTDRTRRLDLSPMTCFQRIALDRIGIYGGACGLDSSINGIDCCQCCLTGVVERPDQQQNSSGGYSGLPYSEIYQSFRRAGHRLLSDQIFYLTLLGFIPLIIAGWFGGPMLLDSKTVRRGIVRGAILVSGTLACVAFWLVRA